jgi:nucleoside-diphosphate-sugar epimerase
LELLELGALPARAGEPDVLLADTTLLRSIGFTPSWTLDHAMDATVAWWRGHLRKEIMP